MWPGMNPNNGPPPPHLGGWSGGAMDQNQWTTYYQTMPENQVDWAALAQQWIANRGTAQHQPDPNYSSGFSASAPQVAPALRPAAPPPPLISHQETPPTPMPPQINPIQHHNHESGGGVANMDLVEEDEDQQQHHFSGYEAHSNQYDGGRGYYPQQPRFQPRHGGGGQQFRPRGKRPFQNQQQNWNPNYHHSSPPASLHHTPNAYHGGGGVGDMMETNMANLDAAARKKLPAWIREGLEKMEKEKLKKEEAELRAKLREEKLRKQRELEQAQSPQRSKFDNMNSDEEQKDDSDDDYDSAKLFRTTDTDAMSTKRTSRFTDSKSPPPQAPITNLTKEPNTQGANTEDEPSPDSSPASSIHLSKEEILEEMTFVLRRTMTEILLEVTSDEMKNIATEVFASEKEKSKNKAAVARAGLGGVKLLSAYGNSDDENDSEDNVDGRDNDDNGDSDSDLEGKVRKKKRQFEKLEEDILANCASMERDYDAREKRWKAGGGDSAGEAPDLRNNGNAAGEHHLQITKTNAVVENEQEESAEDRSSETSSRSVNLGDQRSRQRSKSRERKMSESKSHNSKSEKSSKRRSRSRERVKERRRSRSKSRDNDKSSKRRSRSRDRGGGKDRKRSRSRDHNRRSRSRSRDRKQRSRSRSRDRGRKRSRSKSRDRSDRKRSRSKSRERKRSRSRDRKRSRSRDRKRSRSRDRRRRSRSKSKERSSNKRDRKRSHRSRSKDRKSKQSSSSSRSRKRHRRDDSTSSDSDTTTSSSSSNRK